MRLLVIIISVPETVHSGEMTGHGRVLRRVPGLDGAEQALFAPCLSWGGLRGLCGRPRISDVPSLLGPHM